MSIVINHSCDAKESTNKIGNRVGRGPFGAWDGFKAFVPLQASAFRRAQLALYLYPGPKGKGTLLKSRILPVLELIAHAYLLEASVCKALVNIENNLFPFDTWGLTLHQVSQQAWAGGFTLQVSKTGMNAHAGLPLMHQVTGQCPFPHIAVHEFN